MYHERVITKDKLKANFHVIVPSSCMRKFTQSKFDIFSHTGNSDDISFAFELLL